MLLSLTVQDLLRRESGCRLCQPADVEVLVLDIESKLNEHIGVNTMKRLLGFIADERTPRTSTLDIIARYLGYDSWSALETTVGRSNSTFTPAAHEVRSSELPEGAMVRFGYYPDRRVVLRHDAGSTFLVVDSENSKLRSGDTVSIDYLIEGYPLYVQQVVRNGQPLGAFTAAQMGGLNHVEVTADSPTTT